MGKLRILKKQSQAYLELPPELSSCAEVELFRLKDGFYLLSVPLGQPETASLGTHRKDSKEISEGEKTVLRKLLSIRFENRTPPNVNKAFSDAEKKIIRDLEAKNFVNVFKGTKYKDGVYNINDSIYPLIAQTPLSQKAEQSSAPSAASPPAKSPPDPFTILKSQGFIVLADKNEARLLSDRLGQQVKAGEFVGIKGFDGKFYMVSRTYFAKTQSAVSAVLKEDLDARSIAAASKVDPEGCTAVLRLMAENGDVIEKRKGIFAPV